MTARLEDRLDRMTLQINKLIHRVEQNEAMITRLVARNKALDNRLESFRRRHQRLFDWVKSHATWIDNVSWRARAAYYHIYPKQEKFEDDLKEVLDFKKIKKKSKG